MSAVRLRRPTIEDLESLARSVASEELTYSAVGATAVAPLPEGYRHDRHTIDLGPPAVFTGAVDRLRDWQPQRGAGIVVGADGPVAEGTNVAMAAPLPVGFVLATCRLVHVEETDDCFAWAYGTLPLHPEEGEERFAVSVREGRTCFEVTAFSRPHHWLARVAGPIARVLQLRTTDAYLESMKPERW